MHTDVCRTTAALALALLAGCPRPPVDPLPRQPVATVNGVAILAADLRREVWRAAGPPSRPEDAERLALSRALLEQEIQQAVVLDAARKAGVVVTDDEIASELAGGRAGYRPEDYQAAVHAQKLTPQMLAAQVRDRLMVERHLAAVSARPRADDAAVEKHYADHPDAFRRPARVRARQVVVRTEEEARNVQGRLNKGEDFARLAREYSVAPEKDRGGDLGLFPKGVMPKVFDDACFSLEPGQRSEIVQSEYGHHIFQVTEKFPEQVLPLEAVREDIRAELSRRARENAEDAEVARLKAAATVVVNEEALKWAADQGMAAVGGDA
jgi:peptidyl-prolyl cis-trans isomerase C